MRKKIILVVMVLLNFGLFSQVGVNTNNPKATLDVNGGVVLSDDAMTPVEGKVRYSDSENCLELYDDGAWVNMCKATSISNTVLNEITNIINPKLSPDKLVSEYTVSSITLDDTSKNNYPYQVVLNDNAYATVSSNGQFLTYTIKKEGLYNFAFKISPDFSGGSISGEYINNVYRLTAAGNQISTTESQIFKGSYVDGQTTFKSPVSDRATVYLKVGDKLEVQAFMYGTVYDANGFKIEFKNDSSTYF